MQCLVPMMFTRPIDPLAKSTAPEEALAMPALLPPGANGDAPEPPRPHARADATPIVLLVDDQEDELLVVQTALARRGFKVLTAHSGDEALAVLNQHPVDVMVSDVLLGGMTGIALSQQVVESYPDVPVVVVTAHGSMDVVIDALRSGAFDFVAKPFSVDSLALALGRAIKYRELKVEVRRLRTASTVRRPALILGESEAIAKVEALITQVAPTDATVLITGESGSGKELVASTIHDLSTRRTQPFIAVNCAAMPTPLLESELFGHKRGAFTDAKRDKPGLFIQASGGTLFLDEVGEMAPEMQVKLLRVLQERRLRPVGGETEVPFDVRLICATNRDLETEVAEGRFRADLYYRINVVHIEVPGLRSRRGDILLLTQRFITRAAERCHKAVAGISAAAAQKLLDYDWPGNVRELENCLERAVALTRYTEIGIQDLPDRIRDHQSTRMVIDTSDPEELLTLEEVERRYVRKVLAACNGNKTHAAKILGLDRRTLYRRLESLDLKST
jgi:two-component system, NtrC family, response regulator AtoC